MSAKDRRTRFITVLKGKQQYFVKDQSSGMTMAGPFKTLAQALEIEAQLEQNMGRQR